MESWGSDPNFAEGKVGGRKRKKKSDLCDVDNGKECFFLFFCFFATSSLTESF